MQETLQERPTRSCEPASYPYGREVFDFGHVIKTTILLSDMSLFASVNEIYGGISPATSPRGKPTP